MTYRTLEKLKDWHDRRLAIQEFLEFMSSKGYELKKTIPSGWCAPDGSKRVADDELPDSLHRLDRDELVRFNLDPYDKVALQTKDWECCLAAWHEGDLHEARDLLLSLAWRWDRGFECDDVGSEGLRFDKLFYEFIGVDPNKIEEERRALLDSLGQG